MERPPKKTITLKLLIDTKANKVLFAEATKEFVDFLFFSLSLLAGTLISLLEGKSIAGSIGNLHKSFENLKQHYLQPENIILLNPNSSFSSAIYALLPAAYNAAGSTTILSIADKFYSCGHCYCYMTVTNKSGSVKCPLCRAVMNKELNYVAPTASSASSSGDKQVFTYMISDDLTVTPMSMISSISMMNKFNITDLNLLEEREVEVGNEEGVARLKAFFQSTAVFTDVLLGWEEDRVVKRLKVTE